MAQKLASTARTGRDNQRKSLQHSSGSPEKSCGLGKQEKIKCASRHFVQLLTVSEQVTALRANASLLVWSLSQTTKRRCSSSNLLVEAAGFCPKVDGRPMKEHQKKLLVARPGRKLEWCARYRKTWARFRINAQRTNLRLRPPKRSSSSMRSVLRRRRTNGLKRIKEGDSGCHTKKQSRLWLRGLSCSML